MTRGRERAQTHEGSSSAPDSPGSGQIALGTGEAGEIRTAVAQVVADRVAAGETSSVWQLRAALAVRQADVVDRASCAGDGPGFDRASARLLVMLEALTVETAAGGARDDDDDAGADNVHELFTSGPTLGDTADA